MLDSDLALLYETTNGTKDVNKGVKRNINRFPEDFYFQLTKEEYNTLRNNMCSQNEDNHLKESSKFQNGTLDNNLKRKRGSNLKYLPYVFTEQGVAMLSSVLKTPKATEISVKIKRAFVEMRKFIMNNAQVFHYETKVINQTVKRNSARFSSEDFCFQLTREEYSSLQHFVSRSQSESLKGLMKPVEEDENSNKRHPNGLHNNFLRSQSVTSKTETRGGRQKIFFEGSIFDAYILIVKLIEKAKNKKMFMF